jgi:hypothetical protein
MADFLSAIGRPGNACSLNRKAGVPRDRPSAETRRHQAFCPRIKPTTASVTSRVVAQPPRSGV